MTQTLRASVPLMAICSDGPGRYVEAVWAGCSIAGPLWTLRIGALVG